MNNHEYFLVPHSLSINIQTIEPTQLPVDIDAFESEIPGPFKMTSDLSHADVSVLAPLKLSGDNSQALWSYLQAQNQKLNTLLSYVLAEQDDPALRYKTTQFSAGAVVVDNNNWPIGQHVQLKIFLPAEFSAIYCYATLTHKEGTNASFEYSFIREQDRELLIRASLHIQSQHLKDRTKLRELNN